MHQKVHAPGEYPMIGLRKCPPCISLSTLGEEWSTAAAGAASAAMRSSGSRAAVVIL
jgi:hypothetical protein